LKIRFTNDCRGGGQVVQTLAEGAFPGTVRSDATVPGAAGVDVVETPGMGRTAGAGVRTTGAGTAGRDVGLWGAGAWVTMTGSLNAEPVSAFRVMIVGGGDSGAVSALLVMILGAGASGVGSGFREMMTGNADSGAGFLPAT
jgi:hypothetical protein